MIVPIIYALSFLATATVALPIKQPRGGITVDLSTDLDIDPHDIISSAQELFEQKCHNLCMEIFPDEGPEHDTCMGICHNKHGSNMSQDSS
ncbi:hypothetical protein F4809DRAFT_598694 [Biscogniauxia mediterranea]|nr:hypothetical protein F4809DRAFT_598694 [Biscogniauxia mediterranea]